MVHRYNSYIAYEVERMKHVDTRSIESLCAYLKCQPGDIIEYVENEE